jgi:hypothetical protein
MSIETPEIAVDRGADWRKIHALGLPEGSVRAALAFGLFGTIWAMIVSRPDQDVPDYLRDLLFIIMGHYFAARKRVAIVSPAGPGALYLPRGTVRILLFAGFVVVGVVLFQQGRFVKPMANPAVVTLMLVAGFLLGVLAARVGDMWTDRGHHVPRWVEDAKALLAIFAAVGLVLLTWNHLDAAQLHVGSYGPEHLLGAVIGFYFGSRS